MRSERVSGSSRSCWIRWNIYNRYSYGEKDFRAIRECLADLLARTSQPKPRFLWLVGESRWDPKNKLPIHCP